MAGFELQGRLFSNLLADSYPYWWRAEGRVMVEPFAGNAVRDYPAARRRLDPVSILSVICFEHPILDRTMVEGLSRLPWLGEVDSDGVVRFAQAPPHRNVVLPVETMARRFLTAFENELRSYCKGEENIYVLLSGGMDSRVMAATLKRLEANGEIDGRVRVVTWGMEECRDVLYGERLARHFGWEWTWAPLTSETYWGCFDLAASRLGAEIDPKHLHRMNWFAGAEPGVVLAASYGDSLGRAEFSGVHLTDVTTMFPDDVNRLMAADARDYALPRLERDIRETRFRHGSRSETGHLEIQRFANFTRRKLNQAMNVIEQWGHGVEQAFVTPEVFGLMWSFDPARRGDALYAELLRLLDSSLLDVAWARTGARYDSGEGSDDAHPAFHRYGYWLRTDHADKLGELIFGTSALSELTVFDMDQVAWMYEDWLREEPEFDTRLCTQLSWLATLAIFVEEFAIGPPSYAAPARGSFPGKQEFERTTSRLSQTIRRVSRPWRMKVLDRLDDLR